MRIAVRELFLAVKAGTVGGLQGNAGSFVPRKLCEFSNRICKRWAENVFAPTALVSLRRKGVWVGSLKLSPRNGVFAFELNFV